MSAASESRTEQYLVIASSTARSACARSTPAPPRVYWSSTLVRRRGTPSVRRCPSTLTSSASSGVRRLARMSTTSTAVHAASALSTASTGL
jgi:hypothetical protein